MKKLKLLLFILLLFIPTFIFASGNIKVNTTSLSGTVGDNLTFKITATNAAGRVNISSSNTSVATVSKSSVWLDNGSVTITVKAISTGSANITVHLADAATYDSEVLSNTYTISVKVSASKSTNNYLSSITINGQPLSGFSKTKTSYTLAQTDDSKITIGATKEDNKATITGTGTKTLNYGSNKFNIVVTSESGSKRTYTININRKDPRNANNYLSTLSIKNYKISPTFNKSTKSYKLTVENDVKSVTVVASVDAKTSSFVKNYGPRTVNLKEGTNKIEIKVKAENTQINTYVINVIRKTASGEIIDNTDDQGEEDVICECPKCETCEKVSCDSKVLIHRIIISILVVILIAESTYIILGYLKRKQSIKKSLF